MITVLDQVSLERLQPALNVVVVVGGPRLLFLELALPPLSLDKRLSLPRLLPRLQMHLLELLDLQLAEG